jgi:hypothetical protein
MLRLIPVLILTLLAGCANNRIEATDRSVFLPMGRISANLTGRQGTPSDPQGGHAIEFGVTGGSGDDTQGFTSGQSPIVFGGQTFNTPVELRHEFDFRYADVAWRWRKFFGTGGFGIETLAGVGYADLDLTTASTTQRANEKLSSWGAAGGFGIIWRFRPGTSLQSRIAVFGSGDDTGVSGASRLEAYIVQALGRNAAVRAGYAAWSIVSERENASDIHVRFSGPALGLDVLF